MHESLRFQNTKLSKLSKGMRLSKLEHDELSATLK